jgi:tRNA pseudouridine55 synthase
MFLLIDKNKGSTSHDVVDKVREITGVRKVGHAGTLDPNATGLLIVGVGRESTKELGNLAKDTKKTYEAEIVLGEERDTDDLEGVVIARTKDFIPPGVKEVKNLLKKFEGEKIQKPPSYSAIKVKGERAYELARKGKEVKLKPRQVYIYSIKLEKYTYPCLEITATVSSGTYIRALARDIGLMLGCGGYLRNLRRTEIGSYYVRNAIKVESITKENWKTYTI